MDINNFADAVAQMEQIIAFLQQDEDENYVLVDLADSLLSELRILADS